jgi:hypothetical protein
MLPVPAPSVSVPSEPAVVPAMFFVVVARVAGAPAGIGTALGCALPREVLADVRVHGLFRHISVMWGAIGLLNAGVALWLLVTQTTAV